MGGCRKVDETNRGKQESELNDSDRKGKWKKRPGTFKNGLTETVLIAELYCI